MPQLGYDQVAKIKVFGIGGAGCNAVNRMVQAEVQGVEFYVVNTDQQVLNNSSAANRVIIGANTTKGLGAGANPAIGRKAAEESEDEIRRVLADTDMVFIAAGLGGGTGTGAAPFFARIAKENGSLVVGIVTKPFTFEGKKRVEQAQAGLIELSAFVDSLIIVSNNQLLDVIGNIPMLEAFKEADNILRQGVQTITDLIAVPAMINLDFADVRTVMEGQGTALIGIGMAEGENHAIKAAEQAISSPLLETRITGAKNAIVNVTGGTKVSILDASKAVEFVREAAGDGIDIIFGVAINEDLADAIIVTVIATGFDLPADQKMAETNETPPQVPLMEEEEEIPSFIPNFFKQR